MLNFSRHQIWQHVKKLCFVSSILNLSVRKMEIGICCLIDLSLVICCLGYRLSWQLNLLFWYLNSDSWNAGLHWSCTIANSLSRSLRLHALCLCFHWRRLSWCLRQSSAGSVGCLEVFSLLWVLRRPCPLRWCRSYLYLTSYCASSLTLRDEFIGLRGKFGQLSRCSAESCMSFDFERCFVHGARLFVPITWTLTSRQLPNPDVSHYWLQSTSSNRRNWLSASASHWHDNSYPASSSSGALAPSFELSMEH